MAMFLCGLEDSVASSHYASWTLSGIAVCGHRLFLSGGQIAQDCNSLTPWSNVSGANLTTQFGRFVATTTGAMQLASAVAVVGNYDLRWDYDCLTPGGSFQFLGFVPDITHYHYLQFGVSTNTSHHHFNGVTDWTDSTHAPLRQMSMRLAREGSSNVFRAYQQDPTTLLWTQLGSDAATTFTGNLTNIKISWTQGTPNTNFGYIDSIRNVVPTVTSGTATSPVMDTVNGLRGIGWFSDAGGLNITGSVAVTYQTSADNITWSGYSAATAWAPITPSSSNRYVQVKVSITGGSTTAASPEVGPVLVNGSLDLASTTTLFKRTTAAMIMHTSSSNFLGYTTNPSSSAPYIGRAASGLGRFIGQNGASAFTWESTSSYALAAYMVGGIDATVTHFTGSSQLAVEAANFILPGLYEARSVLFPGITYVSSAQKTAWTSAIVAQIPANQEFSNNWDAFVIVGQQMLTGIKTTDNTSTTGQWTKTGTTNYADADSATPWTTLFGTLYPGDGTVYTDGTAIGHVGDAYGGVMLQMLARVLEVNPSYAGTAGAAANMQAWLKAGMRTFYDLSEPSTGYTTRHGRSQHSAAAMGTIEGLVLTTEVFSAGYAIAREMAGRCIWNMLQNEWLYGFDFCFATQNRGALAVSLTGDTVAIDEEPAAMICSYLGMIATTSATLWTTPPAGTIGVGAGAHPKWGVARTLGVDSTVPMLASAALTGDNGVNGPGLMGRYNACRMLVEGFPQNVGMISTNIVPSWGVGFYGVDSGNSSNFCALTIPTTAKAHSAGLAASTFRSGGAVQFTAASLPTAATNLAIAEASWMRGRHAVHFGKMTAASGTHNVTNYGWASPPVPLAAGASLVNTAIDAVSAYGEQATANNRSNILTVFGQGLTSNMQGSIARANQAFVAAASQGNRDWADGLGIDFTQAASVSLASPLYAAVDFAFGYGALTPATEKAMIGSFSQSGDVATWQYDPSGTPEDVILAVAGQTWSAQAVGSYAITSGSTAGWTFTGKHAAADWWGGSDLTLVKFSSVNQGALATAGNLAINKLSVSTTRVWTSGSDTTLYSGALPSGGWKVWANAWDGTQTDVTISCTVVAGTSIVIPSATVATYAYGGLASFDVVASGFVHFNQGRSGNKQGGGTFRNAGLSGGKQ